MANENPLDDLPTAEPDFDTETGATSDDPSDQAIDQQVDDLRDVLKKDAGDIPVLDNEGENTMGGADALDSDFGADFAPGESDTAGGLDDPFGLGDAPALGGSDFDLDPLAPAGRNSGANLGGLDDFGAGSAGHGSIKTGVSGEVVRSDIVLDIPVDVQIILGTSRMVVSDLMELSEGETIALDRKIGEPVEISVNGKLIGRGEITVLESDETRFGVRMIEVYGAMAKKD